MRANIAFLDEAWLQTIEGRLKGYKDASNYVDDIGFQTKHSEINDNDDFQSGQNY